MSPETESFKRILGDIPLFSGLEPHCLEILAKSCRMQRFGRRETIFRKGDSAEGFYYVVDGKVKLYFVSERGAEKIVEVLTRGMTFGEAVMFIDQPYPVFAETLVASRLLWVGRDGLLKALQVQPQMALRLLAGLSRRMHGLVAGMEAVCVQTSRERVVGYLLGMLDREPGGTIELPATKVVVASMLNLAPETFSRILHGLEKENVLAIEGRRIRVLDPEILRDYSAC